VCQFDYLAKYTFSFTEIYMTG